jgi:hypothetical protein
MLRAGESMRSRILIIVAGLSLAAADGAIVWPEGVTSLRQAIGAAVERGDAAAVAAATKALAEAGGSLGEESQARVRQLVGADVMTPIGAALTANAVPIEASEEAGSLSPEFALVEGLAYDSPRLRLFATTVVGRSLVYRDTKDFKRVPLENAGSLFGMAIDGARRTLWIASGKVAQTPDPASAFAGLIGIELNTLTEKARVPAPADMAGALGDVAVSGDGTVYASNGETGAVLRCRPGCTELETWLPAGRLRSAQGMSLSLDQTHLIVADYGRGLAAVDVADGTVRPIVPPARLPIDGVDGMVRIGPRLILIQNGLRPHRITELHISRDGRRVLDGRLLERAHSKWGEPTLGTIFGSSLVYVANSGWAHFDERGAYVGPTPRASTTLRRLPLDRRLSEHPSQPASSLAPLHPQA